MRIEELNVGDKVQFCVGRGSFVGTVTKLRKDGRVVVVVKTASGKQRKFVRCPHSLH